MSRWRRSRMPRSRSTASRRSGPGRRSRKPSRTPTVMPSLKQRVGPMTDPGVAAAPPRRPGVRYDGGQRGGPGRRSPRGPAEGDGPAYRFRDRQEGRQEVGQDPGPRRPSQVRPSGRGREMKFPFDELNMRDQEHVDWVKSRRDPELWHAAAIAVLNYLGEPRGFLVWLM